MKIMKRKQVWGAVLSESKDLAQTRDRDEETHGAKIQPIQGEKIQRSFITQKLLLKAASSPPRTAARAWLIHKFNFTVIEGFDAGNRLDRHTDGLQGIPPAFEDFFNERADADHF